MHLSMEWGHVGMLEVNFGGTEFFMGLSFFKFGFSLTPYFVLINEL